MHPHTIRSVRHLVAISLLVACGAARADEPSPALAQAAPTTEPGWGMSGGGRQAYAVQPDAEVQRNGHPTLRLEPVPEPPRYGTWMRVVDATPYRGKRIRVSAFTRTEGATGRVDFWARVQAPHTNADGLGLGGEVLGLAPTESWQRREIVLDVAAEGASIQYGVGLAGPGKIWLDTPTLEIVGPEVPVTAPPSPGAARSK